MKQNIFPLSRTLLAILGMLSTLLIVFHVSVPVDAQSQVALTGKWDRLNPDQGNPTPEHEVLRCGGSTSWYCTYDKHPEPALRFENPPDSTFGSFRGENITSEWTCPGWFPSSICDDTTFVAGGVMNFVLSDGGNFIVDTELILTETDGHQILYMHWVDTLLCPWFRSFGEALAANPFPTPFNGQDWPSGDCVFPP